MPPRMMGMASDWIGEASSNPILATALSSSGDNPKLGKKVSSAIRAFSPQVALRATGIDNGLGMAPAAGSKNKIF